MRRTRPGGRRRVGRWLVSSVVLGAALLGLFGPQRPRWLEAVRRFNHRWLNPAMLRVAGDRYWYAGCLEHVGRRSGRTYRTPVVAHAVDGGFAVALPYGSDVDWVRNLQASGSGRLRNHGASYRVEAPRVVAIAEVPPGLPAVTRLAGERSSVPWLVLTAHPLEAVEESGPPPEAG